MAESVAVARRSGRSKGRVTYLLRFVAVAYIGVLVAVPLGVVARKAFAEGASRMWASLTEPNMVHAFEVTAYAAGYSVVINTAFGVVVSLLLVRYRFRGRRLLSLLVDLPLSVSPIVAGLALVFVTGLGGIQVIFAFPGIVLATVFVSLPLVVREIVPVLEEVGTDQEQAAYILGANGWQTFGRITLPSIKWAVLYGEFDELSAYSASLVLAAASIACLVVIFLIRPRKDRTT